MRKPNIIALIAFLTGILGAVIFFVGIPYSQYKNGICNINISEIPTKGVPYEKLNLFLQERMPYVIDTGYGELSLKEAVSYDFTDMVREMESVGFHAYYTRDYDLISFRPAVKINESRVKEAVKRFNKGKPKPENASWRKEDGKFSVVPEKNGGRIDAGKLLDTLKEYLSVSFCITDSFPKEDVFVKPEITESKMKEAVEQANEFLSWSVLYDNGKTYRAGKDSVKITKEGRVEADSSFLQSVADEVYASYLKTGKPVSFTTTGKKKIKIGGGTWGNEVWKQKELEELESMFEEKRSQTERKPICIREMNDIGDTYIEISIKKQHLWYYKNGKLKSETDIVTGHKGKHDTPTGVYYISERVNGKYLIGDDYKTWVNKWMRLTNRGIGLHDAYWRGSFGKQVYTYSGSHGCINLPKAFAYGLYDETYTGMPVIIY